MKLFNDKKMIKNKSFLLVIIIIASSSLSNAQTLEIKEYLQEQDQWCWAATTQSILEYYGVNIEQCEIVNYARNHSSPPLYGNENCCKNPSEECNRGGYFGLGFEYYANFSVNITGVLSIEEISVLLKEKKPIAIGWKWNNLDIGHVVIIYGLENNNVKIMDPWEGSYILEYNELIENSSFEWSTSYVPQRAPINIFANESKISIFPNPTSGILNLSIVLQNQEKIIAEVFNIQGVQVIRKEYNDNYVLSTLAENLIPGLYILKVNGESFIYTEKLIVKHN